MLAHFSKQTNIFVLRMVNFAENRDYYIEFLQEQKDYCNKLLQVHKDHYNKLPKKQKD